MAAVIISRKFLCIVFLTFTATVGWAEAPNAIGHMLRKSRWLKWEIVQGRIVPLRLEHAPQRLETLESNDSKEQLHLNHLEREPSLVYQHRQGDAEFKVEFGAGMFTLHDSREKATLQLEQSASGELSLVMLNPGGEVQEVRAGGIWELAVLQPELFEKEVAPRLSYLRTAWRLNDQAEALRAALREQTGMNWEPDRVKLRKAVSELASSEYAKRQAAHDFLVHSGPEAVAYLRSVPRSQLDAEQQRHMDFLLSNQNASRDLPNQVAAAMLYDTHFWTHLLAQANSEQRTWAAAHLARLLQHPLRFDATADAKVRETQLQAIRSEVNSSRLR